MANFTSERIFFNRKVSLLNIEYNMTLFNIGVTSHKTEVL